jgi:hypothetical protein
MKRMYKILSILNFRYSESFDFLSNTQWRVVWEQERAKKKHVSDYKDCRGNFWTFHIFWIPFFNWQASTNFCNPPLEFIDIDTRDTYVITLIPA